MLKRKSRSTINDTCTGGGASIRTCLISVPIGTIEAKCCSFGLHSCTFKATTLTASSDPTDMLQSSRVVELIAVTEADESQTSAPLPASIQACLDFFQQYFDQCSSAATNQSAQSVQLLICWPAVGAPNSFSGQVLRALYDSVEFGQRVTYAELARRAGNARAQRAVGSAMRRNPVVLVIPCHRVVRTPRDSRSNNIGNYSGGAYVKEWLLNYESNQTKGCQIR